MKEKIEYTIRLGLPELIIILVLMAGITLGSCIYLQQREREIKYLEKELFLRYNELDSLIINQEESK